MTNSIEIENYGMLSLVTLQTIFGDEMTYNQLNIEDKDYYLKVEYNRNSETQLVRVWFDDEVVMDKKYSINHSCDMFHFMSEIGKIEEEDNEEEDIDLKCEEKKINECVICNEENIASYNIGIKCKTCKNIMCFQCCCEYSCSNEFDYEGDETGTCVDIKMPCGICRTINFFCV